MTARIQVFRADDLAGVLAIERSSFPRPWSQTAFERELRLGISHFFAVHVDDPAGIAGYGGFWLVAGEAHLLTIAVSAQRRGQGLGMTLLKFLCDRARELEAGIMFLEVREDNDRARRLYERAGFTVSGRRPGYYEGTMDAILMERAL